MAPQQLTTRCCIVGGGPSGVMLGFLLARAGVEVVVLEKHGDFLRDFRGDTIHPSTLEVMHELGLLDEFLKLPHQKARLGARFGGGEFSFADFSHLPTHCKFIALMPQWDFLNFLPIAAKVSRVSAAMEPRRFGLSRRLGASPACSVRSPDGPVEIQAPILWSAATAGIRSARSLSLRRGLRRADGCPVVSHFAAARRSRGVLGNFNAGSSAVLINRGDYFQCGL